MIVFAGHDRRYTLPAELRAPGRDHVTGWEMLSLAQHGDQWAEGVIATMLPSDIEEGQYSAVADPDDEDILRALLRRVGEEIEQYDPETGNWSRLADDDVRQAVDIDLDTASALQDSLQAGGGGLVLRFCEPMAWLPPSNDLPAAPFTAAAEEAAPSADDGWKYFAIVDDLDQGAVLNIIRMAPGPILESYSEQGWEEDNALLADLRGITPPLLVPVKAEGLTDLTRQADEFYAAHPAGTEQEQDAKKEKEKPVTAASALSPLPGVSPDPRAEKLRRYWSVGGKGGLKIKWGLPGDWTRCYRHLAKYMGVRAKGYCNLMHKRNTGVYTGSKLNASAGLSSVDIETSLLAALGTKLWVNETNRKATDMQDGIYSEVEEGNAALVEALLAGGFPVAPPDDWFSDPKLTGPTPIEVGDDGRVRGHIATFDIAHIGMPGNVRAPKSRSGYAYFHTGALLTASGKQVPVGQLTLAGGHAPLSADAGEAVKHYDDTASAIADIHVGEDRFGIWAAGAVRPEATPEQVRALRASAPSGDWRPINGTLELVAICQVNVPGFPITRAQVASGRVMSLVAAGARPLAEQRLASQADAALASRVTHIEALIAAGEMAAEITLQPNPVPVAQAVPEESVNPVAAEEEPKTEMSPEAKAKIEAARDMIKARRRQKLRERVHGVKALPDKPDTADAPVTVAASGEGDADPKA